MIIVSRAQWGARYNDGFAAAPIPTEWWLHHSAGLMPDLEWVDADGDGVDDDEKSVMRQLEQTGQTRFQGGMSYTWLVPPSGRAYVGHSMHRQGAHTRNRNDRARGICLTGNYSVHRPTSAQLDTVAEIMVTEWRAGRAKTHTLNGGHKDLQATECPGDHAYALISEINHRAQALAAGKATTRGVTDMPAGEWETTPTPKLHKVTFPVGGKVSSLHSKGWLSIDASEDGDLVVEVFGMGRRLEHHASGISRNRRWWRELPNGTESCNVLISTRAPGVAGWCLELKA